MHNKIRAVWESPAGAVSRSAYKTVARISRRTEEESLKSDDNAYVESVLKSGHPQDLRGMSLPETGSRPQDWH